MLKSSSPLSRPRRKLRGQPFGGDALPLTERRMLQAEAKFSVLGATAGQQAHDRALSMRGTVVKVVDGNIVRANKDGQQTVLQELPPRADIRKGMVLTRRVTRQT